MTIAGARIRLWPSSSFGRLAVTNFFVLASLNAFVLLPLHIHALGGSDLQVGVVMGLYSATGIVFQPLLGPWVDVVGRRPFMLVGAGLMVPATLLAASADSMALFACVRVLQGVAVSAFSIAALSYIVDLVPAARRGWALGMYGVSGLAATALTPLVGEGIVRHVGFASLCALSAVLAVIAIALVLPLHDRHAQSLPGRSPTRWLAGAAEDTLGLPMLVAFLFSLGAGTIFAFVPTFAESLEVRTLSLFYTAYALAAIGVRVFGGRLIDTHGRRAVIVPSMFVQAGATAVFAAVGVLTSPAAATPVMPALLVAGLLSGGAHGFLYPGLAALTADGSPGGRRGAVVGVFNAVLLAGQASGAAVFGYAAHCLGYGAMWAALTLVLVVGGMLAAHLDVEVAAEPAL